MNFNKKLKNISQKNDTLLCVGLDIDKEKMPAFLFKSSTNPFLEFNQSIIDATRDIVCAYKLNMAFYEIFGKNGIDLLEKTIGYIGGDIITILDGKRNDIGNTAHKYAQTMFETFKADAITINPYLGEDSVLPFLEYKEKCSFVLCRTSNESARDFQDLSAPDKPLYQKVAQKIQSWNIHQNCGAVVGATYPNELKIIREILGENVPILIPGIGAQGGNLEQAVQNGTNKQNELALINSSRSILYADHTKKYARAARNKALALRNEINTYRNIN